MCVCVCERERERERERECEIERERGAIEHNTYYHIYVKLGKFKFIKINIVTQNKLNFKIRFTL